MTRGLPTAVETALAQPYVSIVTFAKLEFPSGTIYVHNSIGTYNWDSQDWLGVGDLGSISQVEEGQDQLDKKYDTQEVQVCIDQGNAFLEEL